MAFTQRLHSCRILRIKLGIASDISGFIDTIEINPAKMPGRTKAKITWNTEANREAIHKGMREILLPDSVARYIGADGIKGDIARAIDGRTR